MLKEGDPLVSNKLDKFFKENMFCRFYAFDNFVCSKDSLRI